MSKDRQKPRIGVTGPSKRSAPGRLAACLAVWRAGGRPVFLAPNRPPPEVSLRGIIITGGSDIDPLLYGGPESTFSPPDTIRDEYELAALRFADRMGLPALGICRGAQLMNVYRGGNLHSDIAHLRQVSSNKPSLLPSKWVDIKGRSKLSAVLDTVTLRVNSLHHQAVKDPGAGMRAVAWDRDRLIQGIESMDNRFWLGVQWHPEYLQWRQPDMNLFRKLVDEARRV